LSRYIPKELEQAKVATEAARKRHFENPTEESCYALSQARWLEMRLDIELRCHGSIPKGTT